MRSEVQLRMLKMTHENGEDGPCQDKTQRLKKQTQFASVRLLM